MQTLSYRLRGQRRTRHGFTLIELLVVVALTGIFLRMAMPGFVAAIDSNHRNTISNRLMEDLALARHQAIAISSSMALCGNAQASVNTCLNSKVWSGGWYVYAGSSATISSADAVLRVPQPLPTGWVVDAHLSSPGTYANLDARSSSDKFGHFTIYRSGYSTTAGCVALSSNARARAYLADSRTGVVSANNDPC